MKKILVIIAICLAGVLFYSFNPQHAQNSNRSAPEDSLAIERRKFVQAILDSLVNKKDMAADSVFRDLQVFTSSERVPLRHFLAIMDYWGEALNVSCNYCHKTNDWSADGLRTKRIARDMYRMRQTINGQILAPMKDIDPLHTEVNCVTCHNGQAIPKG